MPPLRAALLSLTFAAACGGASTEPDKTIAPATLDALPRPLSAGEQKIIGAANDFSFALFKQINAAQKDSNVFTSPLSATMALGMTMNGAAGATYDQMRTTLGFGNTPEAEVNAGYKSLITLLRGLDASVDVRVANSIWYRTGVPFNQSFFDAGSTFFDAQVNALDFASPSAVGTVNAWVSTATAAKIPTIIDRIDSDQVMFLINAIYFKGSWRDKFDVADTRDAPFHAVGGDQTVKLMHRSGKIRYYSATDYEVADLPYGNSAYTMSVVLPRSGKSVESVAAGLQSSGWASTTTGLREAQMELYLPRFKLEWQRKLNDDLKTLGMRDAFLPGGADFTRMSSTVGRDLYISIVKQKTYVDVNEEGTEAAAVTNVGIGLVSAPVPVIFRVDRPFIFVIRERLSGTVVFMGKIVKIPA